MSNRSLPTATAENDDFWIPVSDLMALLMLVFLLIAIMYQVRVEIDQQKIKDVAVIYDQLRQALYRDLESEFADDLEKWGATIDPDQLVVSFSEPSILFASGSFELRPRFESILGDFFPRYLAILMQDKYRDEIEEVRIEGHTSSVCVGCADEQQSYFYNMELSQRRTLSTLKYALSTSQEPERRDWLLANITANGLSFSKRVLVDGKEDYAASRRVDFRVKINTEAKIRKIIEIS